MSLLQRLESNHAVKRSYSHRAKSLEPTPRHHTFSFVSHNHSLPHHLIHLLSDLELIMSSSIAIPQRKKIISDSHAAGSASSSSSSYGSFVDTSRTPQASSSVPTPSARYYHDRRPSLLSRSLSILLFTFRLLSFALRPPSAHEAFKRL